jgi:signal transduction histidine kinase/ligand-binding sensor domain-containing protein
VGVVINVLRSGCARAGVAAALAISTILSARDALALRPDLTIKELHHTAWGPRQGAPLGGAFGLAQTSDGYLWVVGPSGLFRFDGISFERVELPRDPKLFSLGVYSIFVPRGGGLWVGFLFGGAAFLKDGRWQVYTEEDGLPRASAAHFAETRDGALWVITSAGLVRFDGSHWTAVGSGMGLPSMAPYPFLFVDGQGTLWAGGRDSLFLLREGEQRFRNQPVAVRGPWLGGAMAESSDGTVWLDTGTELVSVAQNPPRVAPVSSSFGKAAPVFDHDDTLWVSTIDSVRRVAHPQRLSLGTIVRSDALVDRYTDTDGLSARTASASLVDREGNVWVGTSHGLDRFSEPSLEAPLQSADNLRALTRPGEVGLARSGASGALWVTNSVDALLRFRDGKLSEPVLTQPITCLLRAPDGTVWMGGSSGFWHEQQGRLESLPPLKSLTVTQALALGKSGDLWASIPPAGVFRLKNGAWKPSGDIVALPRGSPITIVRDRRDRLWFSYPGGKVAVLDGEQVRVYGAADGLQIGNVWANHPGRVDLWLGGEFGLARFDGDRFHAVRSAPELRLDWITGIVETAGGDLWLNGRMGIVHLAVSELAHSRVDPSYPVRGETLGAFDGIVGAVYLRPLPSAIEAGDGKIWFSTSGGFYGIDPARRVHNRTPPPVHIRALTVGDSVLEPESGMRLPERTTAVRFDYVALSLVAAEKVRYRYRLDGVDVDWRALTASRHALYTDLRPGKYTFHVIAANNDGVWNAQGDSLAFSVPPTFVQTGWFVALCGAAGALTVWILVRLRVRQLAKTLEIRFDERMGERTRIARDLHDTLLQSFHGALLQCLAVHKLLPASEAKRRLEVAVDTAFEAINEGRDAVEGLRAPTVGGNDLAAAIKALGEEFAGQGTEHSSVLLRVEVEGTPQVLRPLVRDDIYRIAGESLRNAFCHAGAARIEVVLCYDVRQLRLRVRDDGKGIDPQFLSEDGQAGHYGVRGMRERAKLMGGNLAVWTAPDSGTEVELTIPASRAYAAPRAVQRGWLVRKLFGARTPIES